MTDLKLIIKKFNNEYPNYFLDKAQVEVDAKVFEEMGISGMSDLYQKPAGWYTLYQKPAGWYTWKNYQYHLSIKPCWFHRLSVRFFFGWKWEDNK